MGLGYLKCQKVILRKIETASDRLASMKEYVQARLNQPLMARFAAVKRILT